MRLLGFLLAIVGAVVGVYYARVVLNPGFWHPSQRVLFRPMIFDQLGCLAHVIALALIGLGVWGLTLAF